MVWNYRTLLLISVLALWCHPAQAQFDIYGGALSATCSNATGHFTLSKVNSRWYFCDALGHPFFANFTQPLVTAQQACQTNTFNSTGAALNWTIYSGSVYQTTVSWTVNNVYEGGPLSGTLYAKQNAIPTAAKQWFQNGNTLYAWTSTGASPSTFTMGFPDLYTTIATAKYGDLNYNYYWQQEKRMKQWGFNSVGMDAGSQMSPTYTCNNCLWPGTNPKPNPVQMPYFGEDKVSSYATVNLNNYESSPVQNVMSAVNGNYTAFRATVVDAFDPKFSDWMQQDFAKNTALLFTDLRANSPWLLGMWIDDSDYFWGSGCGPDFICGGHTGANNGWIVLLASPAQSYTQGTQYNGVPQLYTDSKIYSKANVTNPAHGTCSISAPCSLRDYLYDKYSGSISALNAAWGSNYTTFDSSGTTVTNETIGTGNGTQTTFTYTLTHTPVSPLSVQFSVGGTAQAGDCPWFDTWPKNCNAGGPTLATNTGTIGGVAGYVSSITESGTTATVTLNKSCSSCGFAAAAKVMVVGSNVAAYNGTWTIATVTDSTHFTFTETVSGLGTGGGGYVTSIDSQTASSINYSTGAVSVTFLNPPANGAAVTATYTCCGWMAGGTGLLDESGSHSWVGTNPFCLEGANPSYSAYFSCVGAGGGNNAVPNANANLGTDVDNWVSQFSAKYFKTIHDGLKNANSYGYAGSGIPYLGLDTLGAWNAPPYSKFLQGAAPYIDVGLFAIRSDLPDTIAPVQMYQYITQYLGDVPIMDQLFPVAEPDSAMQCIPQTAYGSTLTTQASRGQMVYNTVNLLQTTKGFNNDYPFVGWDHWAYQDFQNSNQGLVSAHDNAYDGVEALSGTQACETSYYSVNLGTTCGKEAANFGNAITGANGVQAANALWLSIISPNAPNSQFKNNGNKGKVHQ